MFGPRYRSLINSKKKMKQNKRQIGKTGVYQWFEVGRKPKKT
jgi:hypothetical protein